MMTSTESWADRLLTFFGDFLLKKLDTLNKEFIQSLSQFYLIDASASKAIFLRPYSWSSSLVTFYFYLFLLMLRFDVLYVSQHDMS